MQHRPLEIPPYECHFTTPFERMVQWSVPQPRLYHEYSLNPLFFDESLATLLDRLGFERIPTFNKQRQDHYPASAPYGSHPHTYLKWGMERTRSKHIILELGELYYLVHIDIKSTRGNRWHIDHIIVKDGGKTYFMPCEEEPFRPLTAPLLNLVGQTIRDINTDQPYHPTLDRFKDGVKDILDRLNAIATDFIPEERTAMPSRRFPFTP